MILQSIILNLVLLSLLTLVLVKIWWNSTEIVTTITNNNLILDLRVLKFNNYMELFEKKYSGKEYQKRLQRFKTSLTEIAEANALEGDTVFGLTKFSDMEPETLLTPTDTYYRKTCDWAASQLTSTVDLNKLSDRLDWRDKGVIRPVQDQRLCKGCWAFVTAGAMESMAAITLNIPETLSVQQVLECVTGPDVSNGCNLGNFANALNYLNQTKIGIVSNTEYPLTLRNDTCKLTTRGIRLKDFRTRCNIIDENVILFALNDGPVIVRVNGSPLMNYLGGVIKRACSKNSRKFYHDLLLVGYDRKADTPYYIAKNSWGEDYGENGYVKMVIYQNICGVADKVGFVNVE